MQKKNNRVTLKQVAEHAGVSRATASLIVRNSPNITESTREKVLKSMEELGYVYDRVAANLRAQNSTTIGLIITDVANPFYAELLVGVHQILEKEGYTVILGTTFDSEEKQRKLLSTMLEHRVGGIILCPVSDGSSESVKNFQKWNIPIVLAVREIAGLEIDYVGINYVKGAQLAVEHLINKGHKKIAFLGGYSESTAWQERKEGYEKAHQRAGLTIDPNLIVTSSVDRKGGMESIKQILKQEKHPTAVFCFNDLVAFGAIEALREAGIKPGEDIAVVGFDNVQVAASLSYPSLTTVSSYANEIGDKAANLLHQRINNTDKETNRVILEPDLIVRKSS